ncbi:MAG: phage resistance protein [Lentisphaerae bacterium]|nr:phage resistance protein [Lentisphaerota bacterium]MBT5611986.1 phage resistance protein [Lentisphaerota bacterium]MBT7065507.1 phage resistance protein [Verrucomicrobiota bacterium]
MSVYLKDLLVLPDAVSKGDFVLKLAEGVEKADETLDSYVVTDQLKKCFDDALRFIRNALAGKTSKACYLHGSFGCGKSHFMAVLDLILGGNSKARSIPELAGVISSHNDWSQGKKFMMIPYHMIGQSSMEAAILGGYVDFVGDHHPDADVPAVFTVDTIFADAQKLRGTMTDEVFFAELNKGGSAGGGKWGKMSTTWTPAAFDEAVSSAPEFTSDGTFRVTGKRPRLQSALIKTFFSAVKVNSQYVDLDTGLEVVSQHAKSLGYDAVVLFLDELILWLASNAANKNFISEEGQKISKLVEARNMNRPIPLVSFVARQRDLRELVGDHVTGSQKARFSHIIDYWEGRFETITLEDRNLPAIAEKRVLRPLNEPARQQIDEAFEQSVQMKEEVLSVLLTSSWDRGMFRKIYPFSPAFMEMLVEMSFMLQRDRTALKVMLEILIRRRDSLKLGEIIPVGDLFDAVSHGDEAISEDVKRCFHNATRLYDEKLRPLIEADSPLTIATLGTVPYDDPDAMKLRNDDRLLKTLLLAALAPKLESFQGLTARRLAALNHGTIKSPVPGREANTVITKCRKWAGQVGQIKIGEDPQDPTITIQLSGIDTESILLKAKHEDNTGNCIRKIKEILFKELSIKSEEGLLISHSFTWRGTRRTCDVVFNNVVDMSLTGLENDGENWKVVIDWPFDERSNPRDDIAKVQEFKNTVSEGARTIVILPSFLSRTARKELGSLVVMDHVLVDARFSGYASELSLADQQVAKSLLENQRTQLQQRMVAYLQSAYGVGTAVKEALDTTHEIEERSDHYWSLDNDLTLQPPAAPTLQRLFEDLLFQALDHQFPGHPLFPESARLTRQGLRSVYDCVSKAAENPEGRQPIDKTMRGQMVDVAVPLKLGEMGEAHFRLGRHWIEHFSKKANEHGGGITVGRLRTWMNEPDPMGLPADIQDLAIMAFACQSNHSFWHLGRGVDPEIGRLNNDYELKEVALPSQETWGKAIDRAGRLFGVAVPSNLLNAHSLSRLMHGIQEKVAEMKSVAEQYHEVLKGATGTLCPDSQRLATAAAAKALMVLMSGCGEKEGAERLVSWENTSTDEAVAGSVAHSSELLGALNRFDWSQLKLLENLTGTYGDAAEKVKASLAEALRVDEYVKPLKPAVAEFRTKTTALLDEFMKTKAPPPMPPPGPTPVQVQIPPSPGSKSETVTTAGIDGVIDRIKTDLQQTPAAKVRITWEIVK